MAAVLTVALTLPGSAGAQSPLGTIRGSLLDDQGDPMPGAALRVVDEATGVQRETETSGAGDYEFPNLRAGTYRIEDNSPGFTAFKRTGVVLSAGDTVRVDLRLGHVLQGVVATGESRPPTAVLAEELVITAEGSSNIQLESAAIQAGFDQHQLATLPRNALDYQDYLYLTANVLGHLQGGRRAVPGVKHLSGLSYGTYLLQDGQPSSSLLTGAPARSSPGLYSIDELKVFSNSFGAEYGGLAAIVVTTRRGGNQLSGGAFYDFNADELNALTYAEKAQGRKRGFEGSNLRDQRFGAWLGGPIRKQKTFFFVNYQGFDERSVSGPRSPASVPTERMRHGDFSELLPGTVIIDPVTHQPFPGNVIPAERLDPAAQRMLDFYYPRPNLPPLPGTGLGQYQEFVDSQASGHRADLRLDHEASPSDSLFARFTWEEQNPGRLFLQLAFPGLGEFNRRDELRTVATSWVRVFSSRVLNELRGGWTMRARRSDIRSAVGDVADQLGIEVPAAARPLPGYPSLTIDSIGGITDIGDPFFDGQRREESTLSASDTLTWLPGRHSLKLGGLYSRNHFVDSVSLGLPGVTGRLVFDASAGFTRNGLADFLLGLPARSIEGGVARSGQPFDATSQVFAAFAQDDWRVSNRLTVFLGLRYEVETSFRESRGLIANLDPKRLSIVVPAEGVVPLVTVTSLPTLTAEEAGVSSALVDADMNNVAPRLGFAYRLDEKRTVIRGGAGLFYPSSTGLAVRDLLSRAAFQRTITRSGPGLSLSRAFSTGVADSPPGLVVHAIPFDLETPEFLQYHLTLERELPGAFGLRMSFLGARAEKLLVNRRINTIPASTLPFNPERVAADRLRLPFPTLATSILRLENTGDYDFKALQIEASRRFRSGFGMDLAYTLSRTHTNARDSGDSSLGVSQFDPYDLAKNGGPDPSIPRHRLIVDAAWEIPVGRRRAASSLPGWLNALVGDWTVSTIFQARSGPFMTPFYTGENQANTGIPANSSWRPDLVGDPSGTRDRDNFFNLAAFRRPAPGTIGNAPAGVIEGPGGWVVNLGFYKQVVSGPRFVLEARATLDNALNHPQFYVDPVAPAEFKDLSAYLVKGTPLTEPSGTTNKLTTVFNPDGFASGRVARFGLYLRF